MSCRSVSHLLPLFDDPELASQERESVAAHVARCEACAAELEAIRSARQQLTGWRDVRVPAGGPQRVMAKVYGDTCPQAPSVPRPAVGRPACGLRCGGGPLDHLAAGRDRGARNCGKP